MTYGRLTRRLIQLVPALSDLFQENLISLLSGIQGQGQGLQCSCIHYFHNLKGIPKLKTNF